MILKNLFLLEYMVKSRIEKDNLRLETIKNISKLLTKGNIEIDTLQKENQSNLKEKLTKIKGIPLSLAEKELIEEILSITK